MQSAYRYSSSYPLSCFPSSRLLASILGEVALLGTLQFIVVLKSENFLDGGDLGFHIDERVVLEDLLGGVLHSRDACPKGKIIRGMLGIDWEEKYRRS